ncbi:DoxX family protein [Sungkyunkwania multivorans]|uniref:DoxX family protein n=1 Tax=Sungkyunkwania multivorans TaxID=1173618 RepID=A0ABW3D193_9FLAO
MKIQKIAYWLTTCLLTLFMCFSVYMYLFKNTEIEKAFMSFGYPVYLIYPLAAAKILGVIIILVNVKGLKEWAYAGFFFNFVLAFFAHLQIGDGEQMGALIALLLLLSSYFLGKKVRP